MIAVNRRHLGCFKVLGLKEELHVYERSYIKGLRVHVPLRYTEAKSLHLTS